LTLGTVFLGALSTKPLATRKHSSYACTCKRIKAAVGCVE